MKSFDVRAALHWVLAAVCAAGGMVLIGMWAAVLELPEGSVEEYALNAVLQVFLFAVPAMIILHANKERFARFRSDLRSVNMNVVGYSALCAVSVSVVAALVTVFWAPILQDLTGYTAPDIPLPQVQDARDWAVLLMSVAVIPAVSEELFFRAMLQGGLLRRWPRAGLWIVAAVFAALHMQWDALPALLLLGVLLGFMYQAFGFFAAALLHGMYNAVVQVMSVQGAGITMGMIYLCVLAFILSVRGLKKEARYNAIDGAGV